MHYAQVLLLTSPLLINGAIAAFLHPRQSSTLAATFSDPGLSWSSQTTLSFPNTTAFFDTTQRWTIYDPPTYGASLSPATEEDVVQAV